MPPTVPGNTQKNKKRARGKWATVSRIPGDFLRGGKQAARGLPTAVVENAKLVAALTQGDYDELLRQGKQMAKQTKTTVRHPLRDPFQTTMLALALAGGTGGAASRTAAAAKAASPSRRALRKMTPAQIERVASGQSRRGVNRKAKAKIDKTVGPAVRRRDAERVGSGSYKEFSGRLKNRERDVGKAVKRVKEEAGPGPLKAFRKRPVYERKVKRVSAESGLPAVYTRTSSRNPIVRGVRKAEQKFVYEPSRKRALKNPPIKEKKISVGSKSLSIPSGKGGGYARRVEAREAYQRKRIERQESGYTHPGTEKQPGSLAQALWYGPMDALRVGMISDPRYYGQNALTTALMLLAEQGPVGLGRSVNMARKVRKQTPGLDKRVRQTTGEPSSASATIEARGKLAEGPSETGWVAKNISPKLAGKGTSWAIRKAAGPEARLRELGIYGAARNRGITDPKTLQKAFDQASPSQKELFHQIAREGLGEIGDFSRIGPANKLFGEHTFMRSQLPIFYPMWKAMSRYAGRFPTEHSIQSGLYSALGAQGYEQMKEDFPGVPDEPAQPPWSPYLLKTGEGMTSNPQNIHPFTPGVDVTEALLAALTPGGVHPTRNILGFAGPAPELANAIWTGQQLQTGWPLKGMSPTARPIEVAGRDFAPALPFSELMMILGLLEPRSSRAYGTPSRGDILKQWGIGPVWPRKTDFAELRRGARAERKRRTGR